MPLRISWTRHIAFLTCYIRYPELPLQSPPQSSLLLLFIQSTSFSMLLSFFSPIVKLQCTRITGTEHTSAKARLTSAAIWQISDMSVNHARSVSPNSDKSEKQYLYPDGDTDRHQNLTVCSVAQCQPSFKDSYKSVRKFFLQSCLQTKRQSTTITYPPWRR